MERGAEPGTASTRYRSMWRCLSPFTSAAQPATHEFYLMPTLAAKNALVSMWPLLFAALNRQLTDIEIRELRRLCEILKRKLPGRHDFNARVESLCSSIHSSGLLDHGRAETADRLLTEVDELRGMLG